MKKYPKYKASGVEWIGEIPNHWEIKKLKHLTTDVKTGNTPPSDTIEYFEPADIDWFTPSDFKNLKLEDSNRKISQKAIDDGKCKMFPKSSILLIGIGATLGKIGIISKSASANQQINAIVVDENKLNSMYTAQYLNSITNIIVSMSSASTLAILNQTQTKDLIITQPSISEQTQIANYLDYKTKEIETLIANKQKLIELLQEERTAMINNAITKGINSSVKLKPSGISWIGDIPKHWEVKKLKHLSKITRGAILRPVDEPTYFDENGEWTYLNISDVTKCDKYLYNGKLRLSELGSTKSARVEPNNLIITASATIGVPFINKIPVCIHDGFIPITNLEVELDFLYSYFKNPQLFNGLGKSNTQKNIYLEDVKNLEIPVPSRPEQIEISKYIESEQKRLDKLEATVEKEIELLKEYKTALISEVVTGKVDVRDEVIK